MLGGIVISEKKDNAPIRPSAKLENASIRGMRRPRAKYRRPAMASGGISTPAIIRKYPSTAGIGSPGIKK